MHRLTATDEIVERVEHIRNLFRQIKPRNERERLSCEKRERRLKDLISNLRRTNSRAMVQMLYDLEEQCLLTRDGAYSLFGYSLDAMREYDLSMNAGRTHIIESYIYERDFPIELPLELAAEEAFSENRSLDQLVLQWQGPLPIRALHPWRQPGLFYVHIGIEDSLGSSLPPGSMALVVPISEEEKRRPDPRSIYLLQFRNGYRCVRCVATRDKLQLLVTENCYAGPEAFRYPGPLVRIVGRALTFALSLPLQEYRCMRGIWTYDGNADLILPWEHPHRWKLFVTENRRFVRTGEEQRVVQDFLQARIHTKLSERTRQRYRSYTGSDPHADVAIQMTVEHFARFSDTMRSAGYRLQDRGRFSLETLLRSKTIAELLTVQAEAIIPTPAKVWEKRCSEIGEYSSLFAMKFPQLSEMAHRVLRVGKETGLRGMEPLLAPGSWAVLEELSVLPDAQNDASKPGWSRPLYAMRRGVDNVLGYLDRDGTRFALLADEGPDAVKATFGLSELKNLRRVCGVIVPV